MELNILGRKVTVEKEPGHKLEALGTSSQKMGHIVLQEGMAPDMDAVILLHEILHFIADQMIPSTEAPREAVIHALATGLFAVMVQNKLDFVALAETGVEVR